MKKVLSIVAVALVATMVSCGPSAEEKAKMEERAKQVADSIAAAEAKGAKGGKAPKTTAKKETKETKAVSTAKKLKG